jgi:hypothetical protein
MDLFYVLSYGAIERILELRTEDLEQYYARARGWNRAEVDCNGVHDCANSNLGC